VGSGFCVLAILHKQKLKWESLRDRKDKKLEELQ
jgi:hypothetical protein